MNEILPDSPSSSQIADDAIVIPERKRMETSKLCATKHEGGGGGGEGDGITKRTYIISYALLNTSSLIFLSALYGGPPIREQCHRHYTRVSS